MLIFLAISLTIQSPVASILRPMSRLSRRIKAAFRFVYWMSDNCRCSRAGKLFAHGDP